MDTKNGVRTDLRCSKIANFSGGRHASDAPNSYHMATDQYCTLPGGSGREKNDKSLGIIPCRNLHVYTPSYVTARKRTGEF